MRIKMDLNKLSYIGNGAYCYANSTSMMLAHIGENIPPSTIEVLTGVGLSASLKKKKGSLYFNNQTLFPDLGISKALEILGFESKTRVSDSEDDFPIEQLKKDLEVMPVIIGPVDMGYLSYNPRHKYLKGADHYLFVFNVNDNEISLHDPAGFPFVSLPISDLKKAWKADGIGYKKGFYRYITAVKRVNKPSQDEIYVKTLEYFISLYKEGEEKTSREVWFVGKEAILQVAQKISDKGLTEGELGHFIYFALPLGAKRALDYASFFDYKHKELASIKRKQAQLFGEAHTRAVAKNWSLLEKSFKQLADAEEEFRNSLLKGK